MILRSQTPLHLLHVYNAKRANPLLRIRPLLLENFQCFFLCSGRTNQFITGFLKQIECSLPCAVKFHLPCSVFISHDSYRQFIFYISGLPFQCVCCQHVSFLKILYFIQLLNKILLIISPVHENLPLLFVQRHPYFFQYCFFCSVTVHSCLSAAKIIKKLKFKYKSPSVRVSVGSW